jgi:competence protein ComEC
VKLEISVPGRWCLLAAASTWTGAVIALTSFRLAAVVGVGLIVLVGLRRLTVRVAVAFALLGMASGFVAGERIQSIQQATIPAGRAVFEIKIAEEAIGAVRARAVGEPISVDGIAWDGPRLGLVGLEPSIQVGATVTLDGDLHPQLTRVRDEIVAGVIHIEAMQEVHAPVNPIVRMGNAIRGHVTTVYDGSNAGDGLIRGLLVGDTDRLSARSEEDLRRAGLAHFIAVSGSNVAMFLVAWWFVTAPISVKPGPRVIGGMIGLAVFAVVTRWEPSVIRASVMAAVPLVGGLVGIPFDPWMALGTAVTGLLLVSGQLAFSVGFQLSVAATAGVLIGVAAARDRSPSWFHVPLFATIGAQVLVAPVILVVFGAVPLYAPVANLIVAPIVAITTAVGAVALVVPPLAPLADLGAAIILVVARTAATGPQLGWAGVGAAVLVGASVMWVPSRPLGIAVAVIVLGVISSTPASWPSVTTMVVLDIGQGDAILLQDPNGETVLVDGGSDPRALDRALRRHGVERLGLVIVTHGDLDHVGGLVEIISSGRVRELWVPDFAGETGLLSEAVASAESAGVPVVRASDGMRRSTSSFRIDVLGPRRRFKSENDGSIVLLVSAGKTVFLGGDIEATAQAEVPQIRPDVMVVPHHGSGTNDLEWLRNTVGDLAVLSYGRNSYGHPHPDVLAVLEDIGAEVRHTHVEGDILVDIGSTP